MIAGVPPDSAIKLQDVIFDADFYHNKYPDLQNAFHHDKKKLLEHWNNHGISEGRACSEVFDLAFYLNKYPDLQKAFGSDYKKAYDHYFRHGVGEMRQPSATFDPNVYKSVYPFLASLTPTQLVWHYCNMGRKQGLLAHMGFAALRVPAMGSVTPQDLVFDADFYHNKYPDLQNAFHHDKKKLREHWNNHGISEGRACSDVLDLQYYLAQYPDLQKAFGSDYTKAYQHFFNHGINEFRRSSPSYDPNVYKTRYGLQALNPIQLIHHFMAYGRTHYMSAI